MKSDDLTLADCEKALGEKAEAWAGRCYEIASRIVAAGLLDGTAVYGHWLGPVHCQSRFAGGRPFIQHGWVVFPNDPRVLDPTRWVFEHEAPYLFLGEPGKLYDEGGNEWRGATRASNPPNFDVCDEVFEFEQQRMDTETWNFVERYLQMDYMDGDQEPGMISREQLYWLANAPLVQLGQHAKGVYDALAAVDEQALIPIDNFRRVMSGRWKG